MEKEFEEKYHRVETHHFWFKSRRDYIKRLLKDFPKDSKILDIGCSSGILLDELRNEGFKDENLFGVDISPIAIQNCHKKNLPQTYVMDGKNITLIEKFDIIIASDCLEHIENDQEALNNWCGLLAENGTIAVFVPAFMSLWSHHDDVNMHYRRYRMKELKTKMENAGFAIRKSSYWNFFLFLPVYLHRQLTKARKNTTSSDLNEKPTGNSFLTQLLVFENKLLKTLNFPFGVSAFCIAKRKEDS